MRMQKKKRKISITGIIIVLLLGGAFYGGILYQSYSEEASEKKKESNSAPSMDEKTKTGSKDTAVITANNDILPQDDSTTESIDNFELTYTPFEEKLVVSTNDGKTSTFNYLNNNDVISYSPSYQNILLNPLGGFEEGGSLFVYMKDEGTVEVKVDNENENNYYPKQALWLDDQYILVVKSYVYGTVINGDLLLYDSLNETLTPLNIYNGDAVVSISLSHTKNNEKTVIVDGINFTDDILNENQPYVAEYSVTTILDEL
ncbi:hypothetical protein [Bacillus sp. Au-Bac7]|uniref:hypothetical protein n=1 Tax=Bacillus sp. Au-Bac7 TaxID=2906458 RepID=UPI001E5D8F6A|nr:hypothetical protein [Bacillus sp. Au-Bac7]MCE4048910.1 hypothetical protein [Bacillus sp. Au-Bac7]